MDHFSGFRDYIRFAAARKFVTEEGASFKSANLPEKFGGYLVSPLLKPAHFCLKNIRNPLMIVALTVGALFASTLLFYPATLALIISGIPAIKLAGYFTVQTTITGLCLRTLGRLHNKELMEAWDARSLTPVGIGSMRA